MVVLRVEARELFWLGEGGIKELPQMVPIDFVVVFVAEGGLRSLRP